jgi:hypothetical protein
LVLAAFANAGVVSPVAYTAGYPYAYTAGYPYAAYVAPRTVVPGTVAVKTVGSPVAYTAGYHPYAYTAGYPYAGYPYAAYTIAK